MKKIMSLLLSMLLLLSLVPMTAMATGEDWNSFVYYQDGPVFSVEATEFTGSGSYKFYAAAYDAAGKLLAVKSSNATVSGDTLSASVDFEPGNTEANVNIAKVKTMLWEGITPLTRNGEFAITAQTVTGTVYNSLTNGFYKALPVSSSYRTTWRYLSTDASGNEVITVSPFQGADTWSLNIWGASQGVKTADNDVSTNCGQAGTDNARMVANVLTAEAKVDRVVIYDFETRATVTDPPRQKGTQYYLTKSFPTNLYNGSSTDATTLAEQETKVNNYWSSLDENAKTADVYHLGTSSSMAKVATDADAKLVYDVASDNTYKCIVAKKSALTGTGGGANEMQAYTKVKQQDVVDTYSYSATYDSLVYNQDGPVFSVESKGFKTNAENLKLVAKAYNTAGTLIDTVAETFTVTPNEAITLNKSVDFEKETVEADVSIASVKIKVVDEYDAEILPESTFAITPQSVTDGVYNSFTNGFYKQIIGHDGVSATAYLYRWQNGVYDGSWVDPNVINNKFDTTNQYTGSNTTRQFQQHITFSQPVEVDRVVAYNVSAYKGTAYYLTKVLDWSTEEVKNNLPSLFTGASTSTITYLGNSSTATAVTEAGNSMGRNVFDVDGGTYTYMVVDHPTTASSATRIFDIQAYQKVKQSNVIKAEGTKVTWETLEVNQNGPAFTLNGTDFITNDAELYFVATAYNSEEEVIDQVEEAITVTANTASTISETVSFEDETTKEADVSIAKVTTVVKDAGGNVYATADFAITPQSVTDGVYNSFTNGFYKQIIGHDGVSATAYLYRWENGIYNGSWVDPNVINNKFDTTNQYTGSSATKQFQQHITFSQPVVVDRVVAYNVSAYKGTAYYLTKVLDWSTEEVKNNLPSLFTGTSTSTITYLGNSSTATAVTEAGNSMGRNVFDVDGGTYTYMVVDHPTTASSATRIFDIQAYKKVIASAVMVVPAN